MKKFTAILMTVLMIAGLFVSCNNNAPVVDETVSVSFDESTSRSLTASLEQFDKTTYYWKYTAEKADDSGLTSGATDVQLWIKGGNAQNPTGTGLGSVAGFSQGIWDFKLFAYKLVGTDYKLAYQGEVTGVSLKKGGDNSVVVSVNPIEEDSGTLKIDDNITFVPKKNGDSTTGFTKIYTVTELGTTDPVSLTTGTNEWSLEVGAYKVKVDFVKDGYVYASGSVVATVYSNLTTTVSGTLNELVTEAVFDSSINPDVMNRVASSEPVDYSDISETGTITLSESGTPEAKVEASVPKGAVAEAIKQVTGKVSATNEQVSMSVSVNTTSATSNSIELEISMSATVKYTDDSDNEVVETKPVSNFGEGNIITVQVELQKNLQNVRVTHNRVPMSSITTESATTEGYSYNADTGILTIQTSSFSPFGITYDEPVYVATVGNMNYTTLQDAVDAAGNRATIVLTNDVVITEPITIKTDDNVILDLNGCSITATGTAIINNGTLTIKDSGTNGQIQSTRNVAVGVGDNSTTTIESGAYSGQEGAVITGYATGAIININGGTFTAIDNAVISGNGKSREGNANTINITDGTFNGGITTSGYVACGIYAPWKDVINVSGGTFNITNGAGIVARAGDVTINGGTFNCTGSVTGKVGDSRVVVPCSALVFDSEAKYPAMTAESKITVNGGTFTSEVAAIATIPETAIEERIIVEKGSFADLASAINYASKNAKIDLIKDVDLGDNPIEIKKSIEIDGNGHSIKCNNKDSNRVININDNTLDISFIIKNANIVGPTSGTYTRGISAYNNSGDLYIELDNCTVSANYYALNIASANTKKVEVVVKNSTAVAGWCAAQSWSNNAKFTFENSTLIGNNDKTYNAEGWNNFATIVINENVNNNEFVFKNCRIEANQTTGNKQYLMSVRSSGNKVSLDGCEYFSNGTEIADDDLGSYLSVYSEAADLNLKIDGTIIPIK